MAERVVAEFVSWVLFNSIWLLQAIATIDLFKAASPSVVYITTLRQQLDFGMGGI